MCLADLAPHKSSPDPASGTPLMRGSRLACPEVRRTVLSYLGATGEALFGVTGPLSRYRPVRNSRKQVAAVSHGTGACEP